MNSLGDLQLALPIGSSREGTWAAAMDATPQHALEIPLDRESVELAHLLHSLEAALLQGSRGSDDGSDEATAAKAVSAVQSYGLNVALGALEHFAVMLRSEKVQLRKMFVDHVGWCMMECVKAGAGETCMTALAKMNADMLRDKAASCRVRVLTNSASLLRSPSPMPAVLQSLAELLLRGLVDRGKLVRAKASSIVEVISSGKSVAAKVLRASEVWYKKVCPTLISILTLNQNSPLFANDTNASAANALCCTPLVNGPFLLQLRDLYHLDPEHPSRGAAANVLLKHLSTYSAWATVTSQEEDGEINSLQKFATEEAAKNRHFQGLCRKAFSDALATVRQTRCLRTCSVACKIVVVLGKLAIPDKEGDGASMEALLGAIRMHASQLAKDPNHCAHRDFSYLLTALSVLIRGRTSPAQAPARDLIVPQFWNLFEAFPSESLACLMALEDPLLAATEVLETYEGEVMVWSQPLPCADARRYFAFLKGMSKLHGLVRETVIGQLSPSDKSHGKRTSDYLATEERRQLQEELGQEVADGLLEAHSVLGRYLPLLDETARSSTLPECVQIASIRVLGSLLPCSTKLALARIPLISDLLQSASAAVAGAAMEAAARLIAASPNDFGCFTESIVSLQKPGPLKLHAYRLYSHLLLQNRLKGSNILAPVALGLLDADVDVLMTDVAKRLTSDAGKKRHKVVVEISRQGSAHQSHALAHKLVDGVLTKADTEDSTLASMLVDGIGQGDVACSSLLCMLTPTSKSLLKLHASLKLSMRQQKHYFWEVRDEMMKYVGKFRAHGATAEDRELQKMLLSLLQQHEKPQAAEEKGSKDAVSRHYVKSVEKFRHEGTGKRLRDIVS